MRVIQDKYIVVVVLAVVDAVGLVVSSMSVDIFCLMTNYSGVGGILFKFFAKLHIHK